MRWFALIAPLGRALGFFPFVKVFRAKELLEASTHQGFEIEQNWRPGDGRTLFVVARKPD
jgi:hypothetical protein